MDVALQGLVRPKVRVLAIAIASATGACSQTDDQLARHARLAQAMASLPGPAELRPIECPVIEPPAWIRMMSIDRWRDLASESTFIPDERYAGVIATTIHDTGANTEGYVIRPARFEGFLLILDLGTGKVIGQVAVVSHAGDWLELYDVVAATVRRELTVHCPGIALSSYTPWPPPVEPLPNTLPEPP